MKVLVTYGGMQEPIDGVRKITNSSSGRTGKLIAESLFLAGHDVTVFRNRLALEHSCEIKGEVYESFADLDKLISSTVDSSFGAIIHLSAISDYTVSNVIVNGKPILCSDKIDSNQKISIELSPNPKLIDKFKSLAPDAKLFGFKLTNRATLDESLEKVKSLFAHSCCDYVVHNDLSKISKDFHESTIYSPDLNIVSAQVTKESLAEVLVKMVG